MVENTLEQELNQITSIKSIKVFDNAIQQMVKLTDGKILLVSDSRIVKVLNPQNDYHEDFTGQLDTDSRIAAIISLPNDHFVVSYTIELIEIYSFGQNELKKEFSTTATGKDAKMCVLTKNRFATLGYGEKKIKIWKGEAPYSETLIAETEAQEIDSSQRCSLVQLQDKEVLALAANGVYLFDLNDYKCIKALTHFTPSRFFTQLNEDIFATDGYFLNIKTGDSEEYYKDWFCNCLFGIVLSNKKYLFESRIQNIDHGYSNYYINLYDIKTKKKALGKYGYIKNPILIDEHSFLAIKESGNEIECWKYQ